MDKMQEILHRLNIRTTDADDRAPVLSTAFYEAVCLSNDMKHIHAHAAGRKFDTLHSICQEYYERAAEDADLFLELAIEYRMAVGNANDATAYIKHQSESADRYEWDSAVTAIYERLSAYLSFLNRLVIAPLDADVVNKIQEIQRYWKKECNYKMVARMEAVQ